MTMKNILKDENAQAGTFLFLIFGIFILGIVYVFVGYIMDANQVANNELIADTTMTYSQERRDSMENIYNYFWAYPIYILLLFAIYVIKRQLDKHSGSAY